MVAMFAFASLALAVAGAFLQGQTPTPAPADPMKELSVLLGNWESKETTKGPDDKEVEFTLKGKNSMILDNRCLQIDEAFEVSGRKFANHILMNYDPRIKKYRIFWFTNGRSLPHTFTGVKVDKQYVLTSDDERMRITYNFLEDGHYKAEVAMKNEDKWEPHTVAEYRRTSS
jgi:hypothetical protein